MKSIIRITALTLVFCGIVFAQAEKPRIAFYFHGAEPKAGVFRPLGGEITKAIVQSGHYTAIDRTEAFRQISVQEHLQQRSGDVREDQISKYGRQWGVQYVITIEISPTVDNTFFIEARMISVEGAYIVSMGTTTSSLHSQMSLSNAASTIVRELLRPAQDARRREEEAKRQIAIEAQLASWKNYTFIERLGTFALNHVGGLGSYTIMNDNKAAGNILGAQVTAAACYGLVMLAKIIDEDYDFGKYWTWSCFIIMAVVFEGLNIFYSFGEDKPKPKVATNPHNIHFAILPSENGKSLKSGFTYNFNF